MNLQGFPLLNDAARPKSRDWIPVTTCTGSPSLQILIYVGPSLCFPPEFASQTDDLSWAYSHNFEIKIESALRAVESGDFDTVNTIDELIDYIDAQGKKAKS